MRESAYQDRFGFNVWLGIPGTRIIGPIILDVALNKERYLKFIQNDVEDFLEIIPLNRGAIIIQQDGTPAHNSRNVINYMNQSFGANWLGLGIKNKSKQ